MYENRERQVRFCLSAIVSFGLVSRPNTAAAASDRRKKKKKKKTEEEETAARRRRRRRVNNLPFLRRHPGRLYRGVRRRRRKEKKQKKKKKKHRKPPLAISSVPRWAVFWPPVGQYVNEKRKKSSSTKKPV